MGASIDPTAVIGSGNRFADGVVIGPEVVIGNNNEFHENVVVYGPAHIASDNRIGVGSIIGGNSRQRYDAIARRETPTDIAVTKIGSGCLIFECVTVHRAMVSATILGDQVAVGAHSHVAHDVLIGDAAILSVHVALGGFSRIGRSANLGIGVSVRPRVVLGDFVFCAMAAAVIHHVPPLLRAVGVPAAIKGLNRIGLTRAHITDADIEASEAAYRQGRYEIAPDYMKEALKRFEDARIDYGSEINVADVNNAFSDQKMAR